MAVINTTSQQYQNYLAGLQALIDFYRPNLVLFAKLPNDKKRLWLQRDPLFRKFLKTSISVAEWAEEFKGELVND